MRSVLGVLQREKYSHLADTHTHPHTASPGRARSYVRAANDGDNDNAEREGGARLQRVERQSTVPGSIAHGREWEREGESGDRARNRLRERVATAARIA